MRESSTAMVQMMRTGQGLADFAALVSEVVAASAVVLGRRVSWHVDHAELALMVPEKVSAFSRASLALAGDWHEAGGEASAYWRDVGLATFSWPFAAATVAERTSRYGAQLAVRSVEAMGRGLLPIHGTVTANARRLSEPVQKPPRGEGAGAERA
jgi:hypothetical protein